MKYGVKTPIYVIPTGLNFEKFHPDNIDPARVQEIRRQYGIQEDERLIVFVGRIAQEKSIEIPIEGFRYVSDTKIKLMIVGGRTAAGGAAEAGAAPSSGAAGDFYRQKATGGNTGLLCVCGLLCICIPDGNAGDDLY